MFLIESNRIGLLPLSHENLLLFRESRALLNQKLGLDAHFWDLEKDVWAEIEDALDSFWIPNTSQNPDYEWFTSWEIILKAQNISIGGIGFGGLPNEEGFTFVGYSIDKKFRNQGIVTEALVLIQQWAFQNPTTKAIRASVHLENIPSNRVLEKLHYQTIGVEKDLLIWELKKA